MRAKPRKLAMLVLALPLVAAGCGGGSSSSKAVSSPSATATVDSGPARAEAARQIDAAHVTFDEASAIPFGVAAAGLDDKSLATVQDGARGERAAYTAFDADLRKIDYSGVAAQRNVVLSDIGVVIGGLDKISSAQTVKEAEDLFGKAHADFVTRTKHLQALRTAAGLPATLRAPTLRTIYTDTTFTERPGGWALDDTASRSLTRGANSYTLTTKANISLRSAPTPGKTLPTDVAAEATFTTAKHEDSQFGLSCPGVNSNVYEALVTPAGAYYLAYAKAAKVSHFFVASSDGEVSLRPGSNTLRLDCRGVDGGTIITLYVNGDRIDSVGWTETMPSGHHPGVVLNTFKADSTTVTNWKVSAIETD